VRGCHFQDVPLRESLCLRENHFWACNGREGERPKLKFCDEDTSERCAHRGWSHETHILVMRTRSKDTDKCPCCSRRHETMLEMIRCLLATGTDALLQGSMPCEEGCSLEPLEAWFPDELRSTHWRLMRRKVLERDGYKCQDCGKCLKDKPSWFTEVHHVVPRCKGGTDHPSNLKTLCVVCHRNYTEELLCERRELIIDQCAATLREYPQERGDLTDDGD